MNLSFGQACHFFYFICCSVGFCAHIKPLSDLFFLCRGGGEAVQIVQRHHFASHLKRMAVVVRIQEEFFAFVKVSLLMDLIYQGLYECMLIEKMCKLD